MRVYEVSGAHVKKMDGFCRDCAHWRCWKWKKGEKGECSDRDARLHLMATQSSCVTWGDWSAERLGCGRWASKK